MIVICIEGSHGCGKTKICNEFEEADFWVLDEGFMNMPSYSLHPQSLLMETTWVCSWFARLLKKQAELKASGCPDDEQIFFADRSPFSAVFYSKRAGHLLTPLIQQQIEEVRAAAGIEIYTVHMSVEKELLWARIQDRLTREPERRKYDEDKREWMEKTVQFYDTFNWDLVVHNNHITMPELMREILSSLCEKSNRLRNIMLDENRPGRDYFRERLGSDDIIVSSDDDMMMLSEGENDKEEKFSCDKQQQPTKLLAFRKVTNDNNNENKQIQQLISYESINTKSSVNVRNLSEEEVLRLNSP